MRPFTQFSPPTKLISQIGHSCQKVWDEEHHQQIRWTHMSCTKGFPMGIWMTQSLGTCPQPAFLKISYAHLGLRVWWQANVPSHTWGTLDEPCGFYTIDIDPSSPNHVRSRSFPGWVAILYDIIWYNSSCGYHQFTHVSPNGASARHNQMVGEAKPTWVKTQCGRG